MNTFGKIDQDWMNYVRIRIGHESGVNFKITRGFKNVTSESMKRRDRDIDRVEAVIASSDFHSSFSPLTRRFTRQLLSLLKTNRALTHRQTPWDS